MKIIAVDYGLKRTGIAATDDLQIIASPLTTVDTKELLKFLGNYFAQNKVETLVVGQPKYMDGKPMDLENDIAEFITKFQAAYPGVAVKRVDERFTSKMALQAMAMGGVKKKDRSNKALIDEISAAIILQSFLENKTG